MNRRANLAGLALVALVAYYRINVIERNVPPLRERRADVGVFVTHSLAKKGAEFGVGVPDFTAGALEQNQGGQTARHHLPRLTLSLAEARHRGLKVTHRLTIFVTL